MGIGTATPNAAAALEIKSTSQGLLLPRLTLAQRQALTASTTAPPVPGLVIYQTDNTPGLYAYDGTAWVRLGADNLGNNLATQALNLGANPLVGNGGTSGLTIGSTGNVGLGTTSAQPATQKLDVRGNLRLGDDVNGATGAGQAIEWVGPGVNTDPVGVYRLNPANDQSELRVVVGDVADANDKFVVGRMAGTSTEGGIPGGSFTPTFSVNAAGQVSAPGLAGTGTRVVVADANGTLSAAQAVGSATGDNLGNHTATQALNLQANALVGTGADLGNTVVGVGIRADGGLNLGQNNTDQSIYLGYQAGQADASPSDYPKRNLFIGYQSGYLNTTGSLNQFSGYQSGYSNTTGSLNQCSGFLSGYNNNTGESNAYYGFRSGRSGKGSRNTYIGGDSGFNIRTGNDNTSIGYQSGSMIDFGDSYFGGDGNTYVGSQARPSDPTITNATALGYKAIARASNTIQLGNTAITELRCQVGLTVTSDARFKYNVQANVPGLAFIERLRPVTYRFDQARLAAFAQTGALPARSAPEAGAAVHTGFLAQDVEAAARALGFGFDGVHAPANARDHYGLSYAQFVVPLVRAVQELSAANAALQARAAAAEAQAAQATATLEAFEARLRRLEAGTAQAQR